MKARTKIMALAMASVAFGGAALLPVEASAFCGFYVSGSSESLYNDATQVALMREGTTTVLAMENNYQGPPDQFAMVVPVPQVLMQDDVKTLPSEIFRKLDKLTAPRLVQYWEKDPCQDTVRTVKRYTGGCDYGNNAQGGWDMGATGSFDEDMGGEPPPVVVEAQFEVGEYEIVILSAEEATGLEAWLTANDYNIPAGATDTFNQYIQQGMYFFVAKVDPAKVTFEDGQAVLSPLRFHYTSEDFSLPIRLGMANSSGAQDLIVYILAQGQRYEMANYPNALIPTNLNVKAEVRDDFATFYEKVFTRTLAENPGAIVTEYAWGASNCDPCPTPPMEADDLATLGGDVTVTAEDGGFKFLSYTVTRLHARYGKNDITEDLVFRPANPINGGTGGAGKDQRQTQEALESWNHNQFQGRYIIHNEWDGPIDCQESVRGRWTAPPPAGMSDMPATAQSPNSTGQAPPDISGASIDDLLDDVRETEQPRIIEDIVDRGPCNDPYAENYGVGNNSTSGGENNTDGGGDMGDMGDMGGEDVELGGSNCATSPARPAGGALLVAALFGLVGWWRRRRRV